MVRLFVWLLLASGCDRILGLEPPERSEVCGPYGDPVEIVFAEELGNVTDLSVNGARGFVQALRGMREGLTPIKLVDDVWLHDSEYEGDLELLQENERVKFGHISFHDELFSAQAPPTTNFFRVFRRTFNVNMKKWVLAEGDAIAESTTESVFPGGELQTGMPPDDYKYISVTHETPDGLDTTLAVAVKIPGNDRWVEEVSGGLLSTDAINKVHAVDDSVLALGRNGRPAIIYSASAKNRASKDLYIAEKKGSKFLVGIPIVEVNTGEDELEPWTNADCTVLYFRRGATIYMATHDPDA